MPVLALIARWLGVSPAIAQVVAVMLGIFVFLASGWALTEYIKHRGVEEERARIEKENTDAIVKGGEARMSLDECVGAGRVYDFRRGVCARSSSGDRQ